MTTPPGGLRSRRRAPTDAASAAAAAHADDRSDDQLRIAGLSDALFAIVLTLLVLELRVPELAGTPDLRVWFDYLAELWPKLLGYVLTFLVTGSYWLAHHRIFGHIVRHDRRLLWLNLMFLLCVGLLPFPTALLGSYPGAFAWTVYATLMIAIGLSLSGVWGYAVAEGLIAPDLPPGYARYLSWRGLVTPAVFALSLSLAPLSLTLAFAAPLLIVPAQLLARRAALGAPPAGGERLRARTLFWWGVTLFPLLLFALGSVWLLGVRSGS